MGRCGRAQVLMPEYGDCAISDHAQGAVYAYLLGRGLEVVAVDEYCNAEDADRWEIPIPYDSSGHNNYSVLEATIRHCRSNPDAVKTFDGYPVGEYLADMLEEGVNAAKKHGYRCIAVDWF